MPGFEFDLDSSPAENIERFLEDLESREPEMVPLLREALEILLPLPPQGLDRNAKRQRANQLVRGALDAPASSDEIQGER